MNKIAVITIALLFLSSFININGNENSYAKTINNVLYVGGSGSGNYSSIQAAINDASNGYTIYVYPKQYNESIVINKSISLIGIVENGEKPIIHGIGNKSVLVINANGCILKNFILKSKEKKIAPDISPACVIKSSYNDIENNTFMYGWCSLYLHKASYNIIKNNTIMHGYWEGLRAEVGDHNVITANLFINNFGDGIEDWDKNDIITHNIATQNEHGIDIWYVDNCTIANNHAYKNYGDGINMFGCKNISVKNNSLHDNAVAGIQMIGCHHCIVERNKIYRNQGGIMVQTDYIDYSKEKQHNIIRRNNISFNKDVGIYIEYSLMNTFEENNLIKNKVNVFIWYWAVFYRRDIPFHPCHNTWRSNYWSDWNLKSPKPIRGILDIDVILFDRDIFYVYNIPCFNFDWHPALQPYEIN